MLPIGYILHNTYSIQKHIASGGFGNTYSAVSLKDAKTVAVKEFFMRGINEFDSNLNVIVSNSDNDELFASQKNKFLREAQTLACLNNSHIVKVYDSFLANNTAYYVMEYIEGQTVSQLINSRHVPLNESRATNILVQMLDALMEIHNKNILHLDIKPANIIVNSNDDAKIIDFGASKLQFTCNETVATFTPSYAPIELQQQQFSNLGPWTDLYSLGATFYYLLTAKKPPLTSDILNYGDHAFQFTTSISFKAKRLIKWMMQPAKDNRPKNVMLVFQFLESGVIPTKPINNDSTITPQNKYSIDNMTVYPVGFNNSERINPIPNNRQNNIPDFNQTNIKRKTSSNGCIWGILLMILLLGLGVFLLNHFGYLNKWFKTNDNTSIVLNDSIEENNDAKIEEERELYNLLIQLCDETYKKIDNAESEDELNGILDSFNNKLDGINREYSDVILSDTHSDILENKINSLESACDVKIEEIRDNERKIDEILEQEIVDECDSLDFDGNENNYSNDIDSSIISENKESEIDDDY